MLLGKGSAMTFAYYTAREVAEVLRVTQGHIYCLVRQGKIPAIKVGGAIRIPASALAEFPAAAPPAVIPGQTALDLSADAGKIRVGQFLRHK